MSPITGPGSAKSVWELSPADPDMVTHLHNNPIAGAAHHNQNCLPDPGANPNRESHQRRTNDFSDDSSVQSDSTNKTKCIFKLIRAGLVPFQI